MSDNGNTPQNDENDVPITYWRVEPRDSEDGSFDINFVVMKAGAPAEQRALKDNVEAALSIIKNLYKNESDKDKLREAYSKLLSLSQVGLVGRDASPAIAQDALRALEADITAREAGPVKNDYMRRLGVWALAFGVISFFTYLLTNSSDSSIPGFISDYKNVFLVWTGCMAGAWASFATRKVVITFHDLSTLEEDRVDPPLRLIFTGVLTTVLSLVFITGMADIQIGSFMASSLKSSGSIALLIGAFAGLAEKALPSAVLARAESVISASSTSK